MATRRNTVSRLAPRPSWRVDRPAFWAVTRFGELPLQATQFDGLTRIGRQVFWDTVEGDFSASRVSAALAEDVAAVERFRKTDPRGSQTVAVYLDVWLHCLSRWDALAVSLERELPTNRWAGRRCYRQITAGCQYTYGAIVRQSLDLSLVTDEGDDTTTLRGEDDDF